ncbi:MAG: HAD family hydrolase [Arenicellales bacterium]
MFTEKKALLLDMNSTFMFGEDRFGENDDFFVYYSSINGKLQKDKLAKIIRATYKYLNDRYPDKKYRHNFPSVHEAINKTLGVKQSEEEIKRIISTFAFHELGYIPYDFVEVLKTLKERFILSVVIDIWSPKYMWLETFEKAGISNLFSASSFSSDHGMVKPSPKPFELVVSQLNLLKEECLVIGDSVRRDLGGSIAAGIDCILVGGASDPRAIACFPSLVDFSNET